MKSSLKTALKWGVISLIVIGGLTYIATKSVNQWNDNDSTDQQLLSVSDTVENDISIEVFSLTVNEHRGSDGQWGYDIYRGEDLYIHQPNIPTLPGRIGFQSESDAYRVAQLVKHKIKNQILPPSVSRAELDSLNISY